MEEEFGEEVSGSLDGNSPLGHRSGTRSRPTGSFPDRLREGDGLGRIHGEGRQLQPALREGPEAKNRFTLRGRSPCRSRSRQDTSTSAPLAVAKDRQHPLVTPAGAPPDLPKRRHLSPSPRGRLSQAGDAARHLRHAIRGRAALNQEEGAANPRSLTPSSRCLRGSRAGRKNRRGPSRSIEGTGNPQAGEPEVDCRKGQPTSWAPEPAHDVGTGQPPGHGFLPAAQRIQEDARPRRGAPRLAYQMLIPSPEGKGRARRGQREGDDAPFGRVSRFLSDHPYRRIPGARHGHATKRGCR
jgi:hypothetical protein